MTPPDEFVPATGDEMPPLSSPPPPTPKTTGISPNLMSHNIHTQ